MAKKKKQDKRSFRNYQEEFLVLMEEGLRTAGRITKREFDRVSEAVREKLERKYGKEKLHQFHTRLQNNWQEVVEKFDSARRRIESDDTWKKSKEVGVQVLESLATAIKRAAENLESRFSDKVTYHSGQVVDKGVYLCNGCSKIQEVKRRRKLSACAECGSTEFRAA